MSLCHLIYYIRKITKAMFSKSDENQENPVIETTSQEQRIQAWIGLSFGM